MQNMFKYHINWHSLFTKGSDFSAYFMAVLYTILSKIGVIKIFLKANQTFKNTSLQVICVYDDYNLINNDI